jgi:hypothetical protein
MTITLVELCEKLKEVDETTLLEQLDISSEDIIDRFDDKIEEKFDSLSEEYNYERTE